ncbi:RICIN domain-containing protein [Myxococcus landrumensis]|uniref:RICIN domain-containing protein n=1 Tax=Myxococcus landrumensis TaxID=2813577 RepID=A0ABX7NA99_9BACT|nr:RICIN domain-containing protein [Myxococcus landrumus]QSQ15704.1 RICIN domain-containing protein [Myxococcus landrumus]
MKTSKLMKLVAVCSAALVCAVLGVASDARADLSSDPNAIYKIVNVNSGKVLDVVRNSTQATYRLHQWEYLGLASQHWRIGSVGTSLPYIMNVNSGMYLEPAARNNGAKIWQMYFSETPQQRWLIVYANGFGPPYRIKNSLTYKDIDVEHNGMGNGDLIHQWDTVEGVQSQLWHIVRVN